MESSSCRGGEASRVAGGAVPRAVVCLAVSASAVSRVRPGSNKSAQSDALTRAAGLERYVA